MDIQNLYSSIEVDYHQVLCRFMNNENMIRKFLKKFIDEDKTFDEFVVAIQNKDIEAILTTAHKLKGITSNLGLDPLFNISSQIVVFIRNNELDNIYELAEEFKQIYKDIRVLILEL